MYVIIHHIKLHRCAGRPVSLVSRPALALVGTFGMSCACSRCVGTLIVVNAHSHAHGRPRPYSHGGEAEREIQRRHSSKEHSRDDGRCTSAASHRIYVVRAEASRVVHAHLIIPIMYQMRQYRKGGLAKGVHFCEKWTWSCRDVVHISLMCVDIASGGAQAAAARLICRRYVEDIVCMDIVSVDTGPDLGPRTSSCHFGALAYRSWVFVTRPPSPLLSPCVCRVCYPPPPSGCGVWDLKTIVVDITIASCQNHVQ